MEVSSNVSNDQEEQVGQGRKRQQTKTEAFVLLLDFLRYAVANGIHPLRVVSSGSVSPSWLEGKASFAQVLIEVDGIPIVGHSLTLPLSVRVVTEFFESWELQECFLRWLGRRLARVTPRGPGSAKLKRSLANLTVGRISTLPPRFVLVAQYNKLVWEFKQLKERFPLPSARNDAQREPILQFGRSRSASWVPYVTGDLDILQIVTETPAVSAELVLAERY